MCRVCDNKVRLSDRSALHISISGRNYPYRFVTDRRIKLPRPVQIFGSVGAMSGCIKKKKEEKEKFDEMKFA